MAQRARLGDTTIPPRLVYLFALEREYAHGDRAYLPMSAGNELALLGDHIDNVALEEWALTLGDALNGTREYPGVAS